MCEPVSLSILGAAVIGATTTAVVGNQQRIASERQAGQARDQAQRLSLALKDSRLAQVALEGVLYSDHENR